MHSTHVYVLKGIIAVFIAVILIKSSRRTMFVAFVNKAKQVSNFDKRYFAIRVTKT